MMPEKSGDDLNSEYEKNTNLGHFSAYVLIAGLLIEIAASVVWYKGLETVIAIIAVVLIVAGVWGEVFFGNKARLAGDKQLAEYQSRTAEANKLALEAQLALEKFKKHRVLPVWKLPDWEKMLLPFAGTPFRILHMDDPEQHLLGGRLGQAFRWGNWTPTDTGLFGAGRGVELIPEYDGIHIRIDQSRESEWLSAAQAVLDIFRSEEIEAELKVMESGTPATAIHIFIGRKV